jgi:hypothetical protein
MQQCSACPGLSVAIDPGVNEEREFVFQEWKKGAAGKVGTDGEERQIYSLHNTRITIREGIQLLKERASALTKHIYLAYRQWRCKKLFEENLDDSTILLLSDYQQNISLQMGSTATGSVFGPNQLNFAVFPVVCYWKEGQETKKGTVTYISDDLRHDHQVQNCSLFFSSFHFVSHFQQIKKFLKRTVEIVCERTGKDFVQLCHFSDGCGAQVW